MENRSVTRFRVDNQKVIADPVNPKVVSDSVNYLIIELTFSEHWDNTYRAVIFRYGNFKELVGLSDDGISVSVPSEVIHPNNFYFMVVGYDMKTQKTKITSETASIAVEGTIDPGGVVIRDPSVVSNDGTVGTNRLSDGSTDVTISRTKIEFDSATKQLILIGRNLKPLSSTELPVYTSEEVDKLLKKEQESERKAHSALGNSISEETTRATSAESALGERIQSDENECRNATSVLTQKHSENLSKINSLLVPEQKPGIDPADSICITGNGLPQKVKVGSAIISNADLDAVLI